jgi:hypothetical protein
MHDFSRQVFFNYFELEFPVILEACFKRQKLRPHHQICIKVESFLSE